jgi:hypothetical protein
MPPEPAKPDLVDFATARLRQLFPEHVERMMSPPQKPAAKPEAVASTNVRTFGVAFAAAFSRMKA